MAKKITRTRPWAKEDVRTLKTLAREKTKTVIARTLKRSVDAMYRLASKLGVMLGRSRKKSEVAIVDIEKMITTIRAGGNEGSLAFFKIATETFHRSGGRGLAVWVREAFRELPVQDQDVIVVIGLEARIKEMGIEGNRRS